MLIHEGGHFIVAKLCKVRVNEFAIGFGPTIWKKQGKETKYALRLIPLGGFVSMEGEEERSEKEGSFSKASVPKRIAIVAAGGLVNILFGLIVYFTIVSINGNNVSTTIETVQGLENTQVSQIQAGDEILKINGKRVRNIQNIYKQINKSKGEEIELTINRNNEIININVKPIQDEKTGSYYIGIMLKQAEDNFVNNIYYGFWDTVDFSVSIIDNLKLLFTGKVQTNQLMGPVRNIRGSFKNERSTRIHLYDGTNFTIIRSNKPFNIPTTRWGKNTTVNNRRNKKKANESRARTKNTNVRICIFNNIIIICNLQRCNKNSALIV